MGAKDIITATCDCGRQVKAPKSMAATGVKCPVCGARVLFSTDAAGTVGPPCPHCGKPWPATEDHCPSCMARSRKRSGPAKEVVARKYMDLGGLDSIEEDEEDQGVYIPPVTSSDDKPDESDLDLEDIEQDDADLPQLKALPKSKPGEIGWKCAAALSAVAAIVCLITAASSHSGAWAVCGLVYLLCTAGLYFGITMARNIFMAASLVFVISYCVIHMIFSPELVSIPAAGISIVSMLAMIFGFKTMSNEHAKDLNYVFVGGGICAISAFVLSLSFSAIATEAIDPDQRPAEKVKNAITEIAGNITDNDTNTASDLHPSSGTANAPDHTEENQSDTDIAGMDSQADEAPTLQPVNTNSEYSLSRIIAQHQQQQESQKNEQFEDIKNPQWLKNIKAAGFTPQFPAGTSANVTHKRYPLSPIYGQTEMDIIYCENDGISCTVWVSEILPDKLLASEIDQRDILEAIAINQKDEFSTQLRTSMKTFSSDLRNVSGNWFYMSRLIPQRQNDNTIGVINAQLIKGRLLTAAVSYDKTSRRYRTIARKFLQSFRTSDSNDTGIETD